MSKKIIRIISKSISPIAMLLVPVVAWAQNQVQSGLSGIRSVFPTGGLASVTSLTGPGGLIATVIKLMLLLAGAIAVVFVIIGGYRYITSGGNEETAEKGKNTVVNALIGIVLIILSYVIINVVVNAVSGNGWF